MVGTSQKILSLASCRKMWCAALAAACLFSPGCTWLKQQVAGDGFPSWSKDIGNGMRDGKKEQKPAGDSYFLDDKAKQIEQNLGGGFN